MNIRTGEIREFQSREEALLNGFGVPLSAAEAQKLNAVAPESRPRLLEEMGRRMAAPESRPRLLEEMGRRMAAPEVRGGSTRHKFKTRARVSR